MREFRFFPRLHYLYGARPNVVPIAVTTGIGPDGPRTQWIQRPDPISDEVIDPTLRDDNPNGSDAPGSPVDPPSSPMLSQQTRAFGSDQTNAIPATPTPRSQNDSVNSSSRPPKPSNASRQKLDSIKAGISMVPKKRTLTDAVIEMTR